MIIAIKLDDIKNKELIDYINSFKKNDNLIDYNKILINLLTLGLESHNINNIKQSIQENILLKVNDEIKNTINKEIALIKPNNTEIFNKTIDTLNIIIDKLNDTQIVTNINYNDNDKSASDTKIESSNYISEYDKHIKDKAKEIKVDVDINPLLMNILNNANK